MLHIFLTLIFIRPFISSLAFPYLNHIYSVALLGFLVIWLIKRKPALTKTEPLKWPLILFLMALAISVIFSINKINSLKELYKYASGILLLLTAASLTPEEGIRAIKSIILAGFFISLLAIYQYFFGFRHILEYLSGRETLSAFALDYIQRRRAFLPFVTPNTLGGYLAMLIPLVFALLHKQKRIFSNTLFFFLATISFALLLTQSLGALLSIFLGLIIYFYLNGVFSKGCWKQEQAKDKKGLLSFLLFAIVIGLVFLMRQLSAKPHILPSFSLFMRLNYWKQTFEIIKTYPLTGAGLGNFNLVFARYAHNSYLQIWAEMGILGIAAFLWLIAAVFKSALRGFKQSPHNKLMAGLITANAVFLIHNLVDFSFFLPETVLIWWVISGLSQRGA